ncbi:30S ribosomal protein S26e [Candidatus Bathyarchaeota archaeon]|nr:30S ribosomal protein S26e [Candidatus Bathyarchaeota archaeon]
MTKKRKSGGRHRKKRGGNPGSVQCAACGRSVPRDKAKTVTKRVSVVDYKLAKELREQGTIMPSRYVTRSYCISCAMHKHIISPRPKDERRDDEPLR